MKLNKRSFAIADLCSAEKYHSAITGLYITGTESIATNGKALIRVRHQESDDGFTPIIIDAGSAKRIAKSIKADSTAPGNINGSVSFDLPRETIKASVLDGTFPNVDVVMPDKADTVSFSVDAELLSDVLAHMVLGKDLTGKVVTFWIKDNETAIRIENENNDDKVVAVVMPCRK